MKYSELETIKHLEEQIKGFKNILEINKVFSFIDKNIDSLETELKKAEAQLLELKEIPQKFNAAFSKNGWISYDNFNHEIANKAVSLFESKGIEEAEKILLDYYKPKNLDFEVMRLKNVPEILKRYKFIEFALDDYRNEKYCATIPLLLIIIDGIVNEIAGKGFHTEKINLDVWDSITNIDGGINAIKDIFRTGRNKTREEEITLPFRNGILHGMDLGYDNYIVAAKCWHFLFVIRDWALSKKSENNRKKTFENEKINPSLKESLKKLNDIETQKKAINDWVPRKFSKEYLKKTNGINNINDVYPEYYAFKFLDLWKNRNYGNMAKMYWSALSSKFSQIITEVKNQYKDQELQNYEIVKIRDEAPAISEVDINIIVDNNAEIYTMRLIYEDENGYGKVRSVENGNWRIVYMYKK